MNIKSIIDSDLFLDMQLSTQALYFHLYSRVDESGNIKFAKGIVRMINAKDVDLKNLLDKGFLIKVGQEYSLLGGEIHG